MIKAEDIKPIPTRVLRLIKKADKNCGGYGISYVRFYAYLAKIKGELVKITVAVKNKRNKKKDWVYKQVAVHGVNWQNCLIKDLIFYYCGGYVVGWYEQGLQKEPKHFESIEWLLADNKQFAPYAPIVNREYALKFPQYKYSCADRYMNVKLLNYLRIYEQYPQAEYLIKLGLQYLATSIQILKRVGKDKNFRKWIVNHSHELSIRQFFVDTIFYAYKYNRPLVEMQKFVERKKSFDHDGDYKPIRELFKGKDLEQFFHYIDAQKTSYRSYLDYLNACKNLNIDMSQKKNLMPHDFKRWHDIRIDEYATLKAKQDAELRKELYENFAKVAEKYMSLQREKEEDYIVIIARSPQDLIVEGDILHHCVGRMNYDQKFVREESLIFFVRDKQTPCKPFVTIEYSPTNKKILQCYGDGDSKPSQEILEFVNKKWLPYANKKLNKIQKMLRKSVA